MTVPTRTLGRRGVLLQEIIEACSDPTERYSPGHQPKHLGESLQAIRLHEQIQEVRQDIRGCSSMERYALEVRRPCHVAPAGPSSLRRAATSVRPRTSAGESA